MTDRSPRRIDPSKIQKVDPKKFAGGENIEKLKRMLGDIESFMSGAKDRINQVEGILERVDEVSQRWGKTVEAFGKIVELNGEALRRVLGNIKDGVEHISGGTHGKDHGGD